MNAGLQGAPPEAPVASAFVIQLRIVAPDEQSEKALQMLEASESVVGLSVARGAAIKPRGDVITCDVLEEDASMVVSDLRKLGIGTLGTLDMERLDASIGEEARRADEAAPGAAADAVVWERVGQTLTREGVVSLGLIALFALSGVIAAVSILIDSAPIVVGAMALCPDFAAYAAFALGAVRRQPKTMRKGFGALIAGFAVAIVMSLLAVALLRWIGVAPETFNRSGNVLAESIAAPNGYSLAVALCAGAAGMLSVTLGRSTALVGVAVSITTIPAAADIGLSVSYGDWWAVRGSGAQLAINILGLMFASTVTLAIQRLIFNRRMERHERTRAA